MGLAITVFAGVASGQMAGIGRVGVLGGLYDLDVTASNGGGSSSGGGTDYSYGVLSGYTVAWESFFADAAFEYQAVPGNDDINEFDRTDVLFSVGAFLPRDFTASAGYRFGWQGDGFFDDEVWTETGPFVGLGFPSFVVATDWTVSTSVAVNFTELEFPNNQTADFFGLSGRAGVSRKGSPHSFGLRVQQFTYDERLNDPDLGAVDVDYEELYAHLFYQFSFLGMGG